MLSGSRDKAKTSLTHCTFANRNAEEEAVNLQKCNTLARVLENGVSIWEQVTETNVEYLPGGHLGGGAQHRLQELEQLAEHEDRLSAYHLLTKIGDVRRLYSTGRPKLLRQRLQP